MSRIAETLIDSDNNLLKGRDVKFYKFDGGQPNNRGVLVGTATEQEGTYYLDITESFKAVVTMDGVNVTALEGKQYAAEVMVAESGQIKDNIITPSKVTFVSDYDGV